MIFGVIPTTSVVSRTTVMYSAGKSMLATWLTAGLVLIATLFLSGWFTTVTISSRLSRHKTVKVKLNERFIRLHPSSFPGRCCYCRCWTIFQPDCYQGNVLCSALGSYTILCYLYCNFTQLFRWTAYWNFYTFDYCLRKIHHANRKVISY